MEEQLDEISEGDADWQAVLRDFYGPFQDDLAKAEAGHARRQAGGDPHRRHLREVREDDGHQVGEDGPLPRLHRLPGVQEHQGLQGASTGRSSRWRRRPPTRPARSAAGRWSSSAAGSGGSWPARATPSARAASRCPSAWPARPARWATSPSVGAGAARSSSAAIAYPDCTFAAWDRPLPEACPKCASPYLLQKYSKRDGPYVACPNKECDYHALGGRRRSGRAEQRGLSRAAARACPPPRTSGVRGRPGARQRICAAVRHWRRRRPCPLARARAATRAVLDTPGGAEGRCCSRLAVSERLRKGFTRP